MSADVLTTLDCGCAILKDGTRVWCPTCTTPPPVAPKPPPIDLAKIRRALEACRVEFVTLTPRLGQPYRSNVQACAKLCEEALRELPATLAVPK